MLDGVTDLGSEVWRGHLDSIAIGIVQKVDRGIESSSVSSG